MTGEAQLGFFLGNLSTNDRLTFMDFLQQNPAVELVPTDSINTVRLNVRGADSEKETIRLAFLSLPSATKSTDELFRAIKAPISS
jgi:hypothetical protein